MWRREYTKRETLKNKYKDIEIVTLGPEGTDASCMARKLTQNVILKDSFRAAMQFAYNYHKCALICCGYIDKYNNTLVDSWVDMNFNYFGKMNIIDIFYDYTEEMCLAKRKGLEGKPRTAIIHPATQAFLDCDIEKIEYTNNKPTAVKKVAEGKYDLCIGSVNYVKMFDNIEIIKEFHPQMVWTIYSQNNL